MNKDNKNKKEFNSSNENEYLNAPRLEVVPVKTANGFLYIVVKNVSSKSYVKIIAGRKYYTTEAMAQKALLSL